MTHLPKLNEQALKNKWGRVIEGLGIKNPTKAKWMMEMAEYQDLNENVSLTNLSSINGMGAISNSIPGAIPGQPGTQGSGDIAQNLLPVSMKIAAHTIGLDLVAVKPSPGPKIDLVYLDYRYDDSNLSRAQEKPQLFQIPVYTALKTFLDALKANTTHPDGRMFVTVDISVDVAGVTSKSGAAAIAIESVNKSSLANAYVTSLATMAITDTMELEFIGYSRIEGNAVFRAYRQNNNASSGANSTGAWGFDNTLNTFPARLTVAEALGAYVDTGTPTNNRIAFLQPYTGVTGATVAVQLINPTLSMSSGQFNAVPTLVSVFEDNVEGFVSNWNKHPMTRSEDDDFYPGVIAPDLRVRTVQIGGYEVSSAVKRNEIEDIKAATGIDIIQKLEGVLVNELSQAISKEIIRNVKKLANRGRETAPRVVATGSPLKGGYETYFDMNVAKYASVSGSVLGNYRSSFGDVQRRLLGKLEGAAGWILKEGRIGRPTYAVTNSNLASIIAEGSTYTIQPTESNLNPTSAQMYPMGTVKGITLYIDPYQEYTDNSIYLGRKNNPDQPGLIFVPYLMAQSLSLISEQTRAPRLFLRSRFSVVELGFFPYKQFMEINVHDPEQVLL